MQVDACIVDNELMTSPSSQQEDNVTTSTSIHQGDDGEAAELEYKIREILKNDVQGDKPVNVADYVYDVWASMINEGQNCTEEDLLDEIWEQVVEATGAWVQAGVFSFEVPGDENDEVEEEEYQKGRGEGRTRWCAS